MTRTAEQTARAAEAISSNVPGTCLMWCRQRADIPALYPDAATAWRNVNAKHTTRTPPRGAPVYWTGGSHGFGHIAISLGNGKIRSTDAGGSGRVATVDLGWVEQHWGLKFAGWGEDINERHIPGTEPKAPAPPKPKGVQVKATHASLQFSDPTVQKVADANRVFARAKARNVRWITGTEGWEKDSRVALHAAAKANGYSLWIAPGQDAWIAVQHSFVVGKLETFAGPVIVDGKAHHFTNKKVTSVTFKTAELGTITVIACHLLTKGDPSRPPAELLAQNKKLSKAIGDHARLKGKGLNLVFYGGDQNIQDRRTDTFLGAPLTSLWDELKTWPSTGHGTIDVIASYDLDGRVKGESCKALSDRDFALFTDHYLVEGSFRVRPL
jgi:hypothetical protein